MFGLMYTTGICLKLGEHSLCGFVGEPCFLRRFLTGSLRRKGSRHFGLVAVSTFSSSNPNLGRRQVLSVCVRDVYAFHVSYLRHHR